MDTAEEEINERSIKLSKSLRAFISLFSKYKTQVLIISILVFFVEGSAVVNQLVLKFFVDAATKYAARAITQQALFNEGLLLVGIVASVYLIRTLFRWFLVDKVNHIEANMIFDLKEKLYTHLVNLQQQFHTNNKTGTIIANFMRIPSAIEGLGDVFLYSLIPIIIQIVTVIGSLVFLNAPSAIIVTLYIVAFLSWSYMFQHRQVQPQAAYNAAEDSEKAFVSDSFTNIESIKLFGKESYMSDRFSRIVGKTREKMLGFWGFWRLSESGLLGITGIATVILVLQSGYSFFAGSVDIGTLVFTYTVFLGMIGPLYSFQWGMRGLYRSLGDFESVRKYLDEERDILDKPNAQDLTIRKGKIEFDDVLFHYSKKQVFEKMDLVVPSNQTVALVGKSGSGKSTLVKLLFRLYDIESGTITIDGADISAVKQQSLRSSMSVVPQECILFDDTVYNNILFANPNATREQVLTAISLAQLEPVIAQMPDKENTIVGERGIKLSGGEKQRVSIARAILADKKILVLDEATSALDSETEFAIKKALSHLMKNRTSIIIAHRLSTIMSADKIVVLRGGKIMQEGTHAQLIKREGEYKRLWNLQKGGYIK